MSNLFDDYQITLGLTDDMLGTNPQDPNVMDNHIIDRQRKLIADNSNINKAINKYLGDKGISTEDQEQELAAIRATIQDTLGTPITDEEWNELREDGFAKIKNLRESLSELDEKGITCFFRNPENNKIAIGRHMIKGFMKAAGEASSKRNKRKNGTMLQSAAYTSSIINQHVTIGEKFIDASKDIKRDDAGKPQYLQRSLRAQTAQGPRISLAKSEVLPEGTTFNFTLRVAKGSPCNEDVIRELFSWGQAFGLGQNRNAGYGQFEVVEFTKQ